MAVGVHKMQHFLDAVGADVNDVVVVFGPDGTITKNRERFRGGTGYGCAVSTKDYMFPNLLRPNSCGFGFFKLYNFNSREFLEAHKELKRNGVKINKETEVIDTYKSNHFIDLLRLEETYIDDYCLEPGLYVLIHSSPQKLKGDLYNWNSEDMITIDTSLGEVDGLSSSGAEEYLKLFKKVEDVSKKKRVTIADELFGEGNVELVCNPTHQGYFKEDGRYVMRLGIHNSTDASTCGKPIFPIGLNAYSPIFLYEGLENIKKKFWTVGQLERAEEQNHTKIIENINILPHGGGYSLNLPYTDVNYEIEGDEILYVLSDPMIRGSLTFFEPGYIEYKYRSPNEILPQIRRFELGEKIAMFSPLKIFKI